MKWTFLVFMAIWAIVLFRASENGGPIDTPIIMMSMYWIGLSILLKLDEK